MRMIKLIIAGIMLTMASCKSGYYYRANPVVNGEEIFPILLDDSYELYVREGFLEETGTGRKQLNTAQNRISATGKRIEVEYLLVSKNQKRCLYIATVPDKYRNRYQEDFMKDTINLYDARVFYYGELTQSDKVTFRSKSELNDRDVWTLTQAGSSITISEIREYKKGELTNILSMEDALKDPLVFKKSATYTIGHKDNDEEKPEFNEVAKGANAVFIKKNKKGKYAIYFEMSKPIEGFSHLKFLDQRVWYRPVE
ncbi:MAG: hypothetical protein EOO04_02195 [Chitinophagaceae bacterium]|nr:MAG: hypothetical protein EOO04_02195 [Chitinophagaceae bacterium]